MTWRQSTSAIDNADRPSRAVNVDASEANVKAFCAKHNVEISAIEPLLSGGTRVVMVNGDGAAVIRTGFKSKLLTANVKRTPWATKR